MSSWYGREFDAACRLLRSHLPSDLPAEIRTVPRSVLSRAWGQAGVDGDCSSDATGSLIRIARGMALRHALEVLAHEWAHHLAKIPETRGPHTVEWGAAYAKAYRVLFG